MSQFARSPVTAVLGPTNTGKTHLAVERMCGHSSGMIGFPLRLLAREVYDRVVAIKGANRVALITGEEKIVPPDARWFLCTAESMPLDKDVGFVALDEAQIGADPERGHVFTDRLLHARGRDETMILGSDSLRPMLRALVPDAEVVGRPRFSTLSYAGTKKLSRLPKRTAIVAFSAEEVYAVAEALRRLRGGAAVVMGALSPRTRNAQVAMFQAGEVDYLVATDAIGMGLNMDVAHVAFASLHKFDGHRRRRLTIAEMAQIAGRAGRHQRDGTFGALVEQGPDAFLPEEVIALEGHHVPRLDHLYWREGNPDLTSLDALVASLERRPDSPVLRAAPQAIDLAVLKRLAGEGWVRARVRSPAMVARLWAACGLPDFRKLGADAHARMVGRVFGDLSEGGGHVAHRWFADEIARLDSVTGDVETLAGRIAAVRTFAYIANRADWLADPAHWADRTRAIEERLSDALHASLTQRFVDRRTTVLLRQIGADPRAMPVHVADDGAVRVDDHVLGRLDGFRFIVTPDARAGDKRMLLAAAEKRLAGELRRRGEALVAAPDRDFALVADPGEPPVVMWTGVRVGWLTPGPSFDRPAIRLDRALTVLDTGLRAGIATRLADWRGVQVARHLPALVRLAAVAGDANAAPATRAVAAQLLDVGAIAPRDVLDKWLDRDAAGGGEVRAMLRGAGIVLGTLDLYDVRLFRAAPARWRRALFAARASAAVAAGVPDGTTVLARTAAGAGPREGFRVIGAQAVRVDLVERIARAAHDARRGRTPFTPDPALATAIGLTPDSFARLMARLGFRSAAPVAGAARWAWGGRSAPRPAPVVTRPGRDNAFAALAGLRPSE